MDTKYLYETVNRLREIFDVVRLVDTERMLVCEIDEEGRVTRGEYNCFAVWDKHERCENCISAKACMTGDRLEKFEFVNGEVYHVISKNITAGDDVYALELVTKTNDETLFEAYGKDEFVKAICNINKKIYADALTGLKNRRFYEEQKGILDKACAAALLDIDKFKRLNDTYGHSFGDEVLKKTAEVIEKSVRKSDTVIRYGGDEIFIVFQEMQEDNLKERLESIRDRVSAIRFPGKSEVEISLSIGGFYNNGQGRDPFKVTDRKLYLAKKNGTFIEI